MGYRSNDEKKTKNRVRSTMIESKSPPADCTSEDEDGTPEEIQMAVNLDDVHIKA